MVPNGWSIKTLESLATVERGKFSARPRNDPKYYGGEIPFVQTGDIASAKTYLSSFNQTLNEDGLKVSRLFPENSILITIAANIGDTAITTFEVACPDSLVGIQPKQDIDCFWLNSFLETCKDELDGKATQNAQKNINLQVLKPLEILTPPYKEQQKIAKILSTWDKAITTTEKLIATSKQQKKALMQQLLTGKKRLVNPDTGKTFEGEWEEVKLGDVCSKVTDGAHHSPKSVECGYPMLSVKDMRATKFSENTARHISKEDYEALVKQNCKPELNDILIAKDGSILKYCFVVREEIEGVILSSIALLRPKLSIISPNFIAQYFSQESVRFFVGKALTSGSGVPRIILKDFKGIHLRIPSLLEQQKIASVLTAADKEIEVFEAKLAHFKQEKKALMQQLLTGKRRVKVDDMEVV
ncbi:restriction endonuclease subunit S [Vibrio splendidus]|uniref:restriction endonuclease subunit S n=1 Tax=Vibrio splendidus TaxID=29497 RepID=UPI000066F71A|nr:restriction endonuclease subunit S [Vibrio splendidus]EAP94658.1 type I site-specific deoxyribonuclease [Vibrio splendidus 12B01]